jgi:D-alanyl-D-alanine dipeptidase
MIDRRQWLVGSAALALVGCGGRWAEPRIVMPVDPAATAPADLVDLAQFDPRLKFDIRYATTDNFMHRRLYPVARALAQRPAAESLKRAQDAAEADGYGIIVHDAYRPWRVTLMMWQETPPAQREFVANPASGSRHNRGCAIDCTLHRGGVAVSMPSPYDDFTSAAYRTYEGGTEEQRANRARLERYMTDAGFIGLANEWWHFDWAGWRQFPILDVPLG